MTFFKNFVMPLVIMELWAALILVRGSIMRESEKIFDNIFKTELEPTLLDLRFSRYSLPKEWIQPSHLYKHSTKNIWLGCSWDWRDFYFEAELGGLYKLKDVLPRVIVCGFVFKKKFKTKSTSEYINEQIINTKNRIEYLANKNFNNYYKNISDAQSEKLQRLRMYLEEEILLEEELPFMH